MKKFFATLAAHLQRLAGNSTGNDASSPPPSSTFPGIPTAPTISPGLSKREIAPPAAHYNRDRTGDPASSGALSRRDGDTGLPNPNFITREEIKTELDLLRRLIESRK